MYINVYYINDNNICCDITYRYVICIALPYNYIRLQDIALIGDITSPSIKIH